MAIHIHHQHHYHSHHHHNTTTTTNNNSNNPHSDDLHHHHHNHHHTHQQQSTTTQETSRRPGTTVAAGGSKRYSWGARTGTTATRGGHGGTAAFLLVMLTVAGTLVPGEALCEDRCERVVPMLSHLRALWSRSFKRVGEKRVSFEEFMVSLVQASSNTGHSRAHRLGNALLNLIGQYQDCVMACEHPFSKRDADTSPSHSSKSSLKYLCDRLASNRRSSPLLEELCMTQGP